MATNIKKVTAGSTTYDVEALHFITGALDTPAQWKEYIDAAATAGFVFIVSDKAENTPKGVKFTPKGGSSEITGTLEADDAEKGIYLVYHQHEDGKDSYDEYIAAGESDKFWEKLGNTDIDLTNYLKKDETYTDAALEDGAHEHTVSGTVTVPVITKVTKKIKASATQGTVTSNDDSVLGVNTTFTNNVTTSNTYIKATASDVSVGANGTASCLTGVKSTGSDTFVKAAIKSAALDVANASESGREAIVTAVGDTTLTGDKTFVTGVTPAALSNNTGYVKTINGGSFTPSVSDDGILSFSFTAASVATTGDIGISGGSASGTGTVGISSGAVTTKYAKVTTAAADSTGDAITGVAADGTATALTGVQVIAQPTITLSESETSGIGFVNVATGIDTHTIIVGTNDQVNALTDVTVSAPSVSLTEDTNGDVDVVDISISSTDAPINTGAKAASAGAHTHDVKVTA